MIRKKRYTITSLIYIYPIYIYITNWKEDEGGKKKKNRY